MEASKWSPQLGAIPRPDGVHFKVWAPTIRQLELVLEPSGASRPMEKDDSGYFSVVAADLTTGARYRYRVDGQGPFPDPASRYQPEGVHGPSQVVDPNSFVWSDDGWRGVALKDLVLYELHIGTFTSAGTFAAAAEKLSWLKDLGITALEIMPVADFPGRCNWGYDGVNLFAPARCYGTPDDLRRLVDAAHRTGLAVFMDVVYNHFGPEGNYLGVYSPYYLSSWHHTPWGQAVNLDDGYADHVRAYFIENARYWMSEFHIDGLRLDATHALVDTSSVPFLAQLRTEVPQGLLIAEDNRNMDVLVRPPEEGGYGLDGVWADDFHHQLRVALTGDRFRYFADYTGSMDDLARTMRQGWFYTGERSVFSGERRGSDPGGIPMERFVVCIQNHDQVGNLPHGDRLHHQVGSPAWRAASVLLLFSPCTPLLFMGQEFEASSPFAFFTDMPPELGKMVTAGRRREFAGVPGFDTPDAQGRIPDPQAPETYENSKLRWDELERPQHRHTAELYRRLLEFRRGLQGGFRVEVAGDGAVAVMRHGLEGERFAALVQLTPPAAQPARDSTPVPLPWTGPWEVVMTTEDEPYSSDPQPPVATDAGWTFSRPGAVLLRRPKTLL